MADTKKKILFIDNFDSFTYNLVDDFCKRDCLARVYRADTELEELKRLADEFRPALLPVTLGYQLFRLFFGASRLRLP